jgi:nucleotidyltransferase substrate binding protein (TIGR01987 family)
MTSDKLDIRWKQRFQNYQKALAQLTEAVDLLRQRPLSSIEQQGFVKAFESTHELAWNVMKDYFLYQGNSRIMGSRDAVREAFQNQMIGDGDSWMDMIKTRNKAVHTYDEAMTDDVIRKTAEVYYSLFVDYEQLMQKIFNEQ